MKKTRFIATLVAATVALSVGAVPAQATYGNSNPNHCTAREYRAVKMDMTKKQVKRILDGRGKQTYSSSYREWVDTSYWEDTWVDDGYWEQEWVIDGYWGDPYWNGHYWVDNWVDTSYWQENWHDAGYWDSSYVEDGHWKTHNTEIRSYGKGANNKKCDITFDNGRVSFKYRY